MFSFLKLIRVQNLLIIAFTQYVVRWCLVYPILKAHSLYYTLQLTELQFFLLVLSTVMIAAAGYIINDYFDVRIDKINKPERLVIDKGIKRRVAIGAHTVINILALLIAGGIAYSIGSWRLVLIHFICASGLWFYSTTFKRQFLIGNVVIAAFTALVPLIVAIYELLPAYKAYIPLEEGLSFKPLWRAVFAVSFFAFMTTLIREIIKDMEDYEGDKEYGCNTVPIIIGKQYTKIVVVVLSLITMSCLAYLQVLQWKFNQFTDFYYFLFVLQIPFLFLIYKTSTAVSKNNFRLAGNTAKSIMFMGVCYLFIYAHFILSHINAI
jgi:4-hydroxybenzoate polyprenyltransferase